VGVESQNSLTKAQSHEWLSHWKNGRKIEVTFRMLPIDMMIPALKAEALDAIIAPSPWGIHAETTGLGKRDLRFSPGKFAQRLVMVCHREFLEEHPGLCHSLVKSIAEARNLLTSPAKFTESIERMSRSGRPTVQGDVLEIAADLHSFASLNKDFVPDVPKLLAELMALDDFSVLPGHVSPCEQTARLLLPA
jgi:ABC-type nitrate/sulfonate/bicarbonate transport system substrate-binding protein